MWNDKMPVTLERAIKKHKDIIVDYHFEEDGFGGPKQGPISIWISLKQGYRCSLSDTGTVHEATAKEAIMALNSVRKVEE